MRPQPLQVFCDDIDRTWSLSLETIGDRVATMRLSNAPLALTGARRGRLMAEIREPRQLETMLSRVIDSHESPSDLAVELMDLLLTLSPEKPGIECLDFMRWRLCEWIVENRRGRSRRENVA